MRNPTTTDRPEQSHDFVHGRRARLGLLLLLLATVVFAAGALFAKFKLETARESVAAALAERFGATLTMDTVSVNGIRGFRVDQLRIEMPSEDGPSISFFVPTAFVDIDLNRLLYGDVMVERIDLDYARIVIERPENGDWHKLQVFNLAEEFSLRPTEAFRVTGKHGQLEIRNVVGDTRLRVDRVRFDVAHLIDAEDLTARIEGDLSSDPNKHVDVRLTLASIENFDLQIQTAALSADDVNIFLPAERRFVESGVAQPTLWLNGRPDRTIMVTLETSFRNLFIRDQPEFLPKANGALIAHATYSLDEHLFSITTAKADSEDLGGVVEGSVSFAGTYPAFDLRLKATRLPIAQILTYALDGEMDDFTQADMMLNEPHELVIALQGTSDAPKLSGAMRAASGEFSFAPKNPDHPQVSLLMGPMEGSWNTDTETLAGTFTVLDGEVRHDATGLTAEGIAGTLTIQDGQVRMDPLNARVTGNAFVGQLAYELESSAGELTVSGALSNIETTELAKVFKRVELAGDATISNCLIVKDANGYAVTAQIDATQSQVDYDWWFRKPAGVGAVASVAARITPYRSMTVTIDAEAASSQIDAEMTLGYSKGAKSPWYLASGQASSSRLDVTTIGKCLRMPYRLVGGTGTAGHFRWDRNPQFPDGGRISMGCYIDDLTLVPNEADAKPMRGSGLTLEADLQNTDTRVGTLSLYAKDTDLPALREIVFLPLRPEVDDPEHPFLPRDWDYTLASDRLRMPPWVGTNFTGQAYTHADVAGFERYGATIGDEGRIDGVYRLTRAQNAYTSDVKWNKVPATMFLEHLNYAPVLTGLMSGNVSYALDRDDPSTLKGDGEFTIGDGRFSADFILTLIEGRMQNELAALPPSLEFHELHSTVNFEGDTVRTPVIRLASPGLQVAAEGQYVHDGDLTYTVRVAVAPDMAEKIPTLRESFNLQGHRLSARDIELAFKIDGPTFNPQGQLEKLPPASVALVSGAFEVGSEALKVIDAPRRILVDLLKLGGGIVGVGK